MCITEFGYAYYFFLKQFNSLLIIYMIENKLKKFGKFYANMKTAFELKFSISNSIFSHHFESNIQRVEIQSFAEKILILKISNA